MNKTDPKYHVGDRVRIISSVIGSKHADEFIGTEQEVDRVIWCDLCGRYEYRIKDKALLWCDDDFEFASQVDLPEFDTSESDLLSLFS